MPCRHNSSLAIINAISDVVAAHGRGETVFEPRVHLVPDNFVPNYERGLPSELALLALHDPTTGVPLAIVDAMFITEAQTGAMTAVGAKYLARRHSRILGHAGARGTAFANVTMLDALFDFDEIRVTSRRPESREAFARRLREVTETPVRITAAWPMPSMAPTSWSRQPG